MIFKITILYYEFTYNSLAFSHILCLGNKNRKNNAIMLIYVFCFIWKNRLLVNLPNHPESLFLYLTLGFAQVEKSGKISLVQSMWKNGCLGVSSDFRQRIFCEAVD